MLAGPATWGEPGGSPHFLMRKRGESCRAKVFFRNICAHGERLYSYKTKNAIPDFPIHDKLGIIKKESNMNVENMICLRS